VTLALRVLARRGYVDSSFDVDERGEQYPTYSATERGLAWLEANQNRLVLRRKDRKVAFNEDDVPF
jgi:hypothetical protein